MKRSTTSERLIAQTFKISKRKLNPVSTVLTSSYKKEQEVGASPIFQIRISLRRSKKCFPKCTQTKMSCLSRSKWVQSGRNNAEFQFSLYKKNINWYYLLGLNKKQPQSNFQTSYQDMCKYFLICWTGRKAFYWNCKGAEGIFWKTALNATPHQILDFRMLSGQGSSPGNSPIQTDKHDLLFQWTDPHSMRVQRWHP